MFNKTKKSVKTIAQIVIIIAIMMIFGNAIGLIVIHGLLSEVADSFSNDPIMSKYDQISIFSLVMGIGFLIAGINVLKFRSWARTLMIICLFVFVLGMWALGIYMLFNLNEVPILFGIAVLLTALFWTVPPILLFRFFNREDIRKQFN